jgi:ribonuclease D
MNKSIDNESISSLPKIEFEGKIIVVDNIKDVEACVEVLSGYDVIGFDTETKPSFKKGKSNQHQVSLLQLSTGDVTFLFRLNKIGLPKTLCKLLADNNIIKAGAAVHDDIKALKILNGFSDGGFVDIQKLAEELGIESISLRKLTAYFFQKRLSKNQRLSNWEVDQLSHPQAIYAATDAWISLKIYYELRKLQQV